MIRVRALSLVIALNCALATSAAAQGTVDDVIGFLVTNQAVPTGDFQKDQAAAQDARAEKASGAELARGTAEPALRTAGTRGRGRAFEPSIALVHGH